MSNTNLPLVDDGRDAYLGGVLNQDTRAGTTIHLTLLLGHAGIPSADDPTSRDRLFSTVIGGSLDQGISMLITRKHESYRSLMLKYRALTLLARCLALGLCLLRPSDVRGQGRLEEVEMAGYLLVPHEKVDLTYDAGFSIYVAAWPLLKQYPGQRFQTGLFGTWMFAQYQGAKPADLYSDIEGGLGWWRDTRFATETPKFIMGGVAPNFSEWANGPGAGKGRDWNKPQGKYGVAQLSPWVLWPPDGLNLKQGTCGELVGYGYLPLPLTRSKSTTAGKSVPTGDNSWTLFLNTRNFKGPVTFFTPFFWSRTSADDPRLVGMLLDCRPSDPNKALQMETQYVPSFQSVDSRGETYARIAPTSFPRNPRGDSVVVHRITAYNKGALWDAVRTWFEDGPPASGAIDLKGASVHTFNGKGGSTWKIYPSNGPKEKKVPISWNSFASPVALDSITYGYRWNYTMATKTDSKDGPLVTLPEYFHLVKEKPGVRPVNDVLDVHAAAAQARPFLR